MQKRVITAIVVFVISIFISLTSVSAANKLTFSGASTATYDGSAAVTVTIPTAGTGLSLSSNKFNLATSGVSSGTYGSVGTTSYIPQITVDAYGRLTKVTSVATRAAVDVLYINTSLQSNYDSQKITIGSKRYDFYIICTQPDIGYTKKITNIYYDINHGSNLSRVRSGYVPSPTPTVPTTLNHMIVNPYVDYNSGIAYTTYRELYIDPYSGTDYIVFDNGYCSGSTAANNRKVIPIEIYGFLL